MYVCAVKGEVLRAMASRKKEGDLSNISMGTDNAARSQLLGLIWSHTHCHSMCVCVCV